MAGFSHPHEIRRETERERLRERLRDRENKALIVSKEEKEKGWEKEEAGVVLECPRNRTTSKLGKEGIVTRLKSEQKKR